jgi:drug/metabolite transporter (DMT)-like permease
MAWSTSGLFIRSLTPDIWTILFWRGCFGCLSILTLAVIERRSLALDFRRALLPTALLLIAISALGKLAFIAALRNTTIANVAIIYATLPFWTAGIGWAWLGERPGIRALGASLVAGIGVLVMMEGSFSSMAESADRLFGDVMALTTTLSMAIMTVIMRRNREFPMLEATALSGLVAMAIASPLADPLSVSATQLALLAGFGIVTQGLGLGLYTMGARRIPSVQAALLSATEVPFSPLWVWIFFNEVPPTTSFIGGGLVLTAIGSHFLGSLRAKD